MVGPAGNRLRVDKHDGTSRSYQYDAMYRLTVETVTDSSAAVLYNNTFTYDAVGNRTSQNRSDGGLILYSYDVRDRLIDQTGATSTWDDNGNLVSRSGAGGMDLSRDYEDQLKRLTLADGTVARHRYDVDGNRLRTEITAAGGGTGEALNLLVDPTGPLAHVVAASDDAGNLLTYYVRGDDLLAVIQPTGVRFLHSEGLGSVRVLTDISEQVTYRMDYEAFGALRALQGDDPGTYLFAGERIEPNTGFYDLRARWMSPATGIFLSEDPLLGVADDPRSLHKYLYAKADPVNLVDPTGEITVGQFLTGLTVAGLALNTYQFQGNTRRALGAENDEERIKYSVDAGLNLFGMFLAFTGIGPWASGGTAFAGATAGGSQGVVWVIHGTRVLGAAGQNQSAAGAAVAIPVGQLLGGLIFARSPHKAEWELRDDKGRIRTRGKVESGGTKPGRRLTWPEQARVHTERKILGKLRNIVRKGDIVTIRGTKVPCNPGNAGCRNAMAEFAKEMGVKIIYRQVGNPTPWIFGG